MYCRISSMCSSTEAKCFSKLILKRNPLRLLSSLLPYWLLTHIQNSCMCQLFIFFISGIMHFKEMHTNSYSLSSSVFFEMVKGFIFKNPQFKKGSAENVKHTYSLLYANYTVHMWYIYILVSCQVLQEKFKIEMSHQLKK